MISKNMHAPSIQLYCLHVYAKNTRQKNLQVMMMGIYRSMCLTQWRKIVLFDCICQYEVYVLIRFVELCIQHVSGKQNFQVVSDLSIPTEILKATSKLIKKILILIIIVLIWPVWHSWYVKTSQILSTLHFIEIFPFHNLDH